MWGISPTLLIKESPIHGLGVFANVDIPAWTPITQYPAHYVYKDGKITVYKMYGKRTKDEILDMHKRYGLTISKGLTIIGDKDIYNVNECGHLLNDASMIEFPEKSMLSKTKLKHLIRDYYNQTRYKVNTIYFQGHLISTRNIREGEEILCSYGARYWFNLKYGMFDKTYANDILKLKKRYNGNLQITPPQPMWR